MSATCETCGGNGAERSEEYEAVLCADCYVSRSTYHQGTSITYHQDQDQDQDQEQQRSDLPSPTCPPGPGGISATPPGGISGPEPSLIDLALDEYKAGRLVPVEVELGPMPPRAGHRMLAIAEHMRLLMGLRLAMGETRPLPYATSLPVTAGLVPDKGTASKVLRALVAFGTIAYRGTLPPLSPGRDGTRLYEPPGGMP